MRVRIINKNREGVTFSLKGTHVVLTWEEFNANWTLTEDKLHATPNPEQKKVFDEIDKLVQEAAVAFIHTKLSIATDSTKLASFAIMGKCGRLIAELTGWTTSQITNLIGERVAAITGAGARYGANKPNKHASNKRPKDKVVEHYKYRQQRQDKPATETIGDSPEGEKLRKILETLAQDDKEKA